MNARLYDPTLARMLAPDNLVGDPTNTQAYNRYSYVWNNPLKYTDPSGNDLVSAIAGVITVGVRAVPFLLQTGTQVASTAINVGIAVVNAQAATTTSVSITNNTQQAMAMGAETTTYTGATEDCCPGAGRNIGGDKFEQQQARNDAAAGNLDLDIYEGAMNKITSPVFNTVLGVATGGVFSEVSILLRPTFTLSGRIITRLNLSWVNSKTGELTNGVYTVSKEAMKKHIFGGVAGKSLFYPTVNAEKAVLDAAQYADEMGLWIGNKAKVPVINTNIGTLGNGSPTNVINVYKNSNGFIHGSPGTPF